MQNTDYARIHDLIDNADYEEAAVQLSIYSPADVADFVASFVYDEDRDTEPMNMRIKRVIHWMKKLESQLQLFVFSNDVSTSRLMVNAKDEQHAWNRLDAYLKDHSDMLGPDHWKLQQIAGKLGKLTDGVYSVT